MWKAYGIEVTVEDKTAWEAAVEAFQQARRPTIASQTCASTVRGVLTEDVFVLGAAEVGLDGSRAILT